MVTFEITGNGIPMELWSVELEALHTVPPDWPQAARIGEQQARLLERSRGHLHKVSALARQLVGDHGFCRLVQRGDWHGDRCVMELLPQGIFLKPKKDGAEETIYSMLTRLARARLDLDIALPVHREGGFLIQKGLPSNHAAWDPHRAGTILGFVFMLGITDLNAENLRLCHGVPVPIDVECAFDFVFYDHASEDVVLRRLREQARAIEIAHGEDHGGNTGHPAFAAAFLGAAEFTREMLLERLAEPAALDRLLLRRVFLPTRVYLNFMRRSALFGWSADTASRRWEELRAGTISRTMVDAEIRALISGNVPFFHRRGDCLLDGSDGMMLLELGKPLSEEATRWAKRWEKPGLKELAGLLATGSGRLQSRQNSPSILESP